MNLLLKRTLHLLAYLLIISGSRAQVVTIDPVFATQHDSITIFFNAALGNGALKGQAQVYAHTGVITNKSATPTSWMNVQGNWGTDDARVKMFNMGGDLHRLSFRISTFYGLGSTDTVKQLAFVFRNMNGSVVGRDADGSDIFVPLPGNSGQFQVLILQPAAGALFDSAAPVLVQGTASDSAELIIRVNGQQIGMPAHGKSIVRTFTAAQTGDVVITIEADRGGQKASQTTTIIVAGAEIIAEIPAGSMPGVNYDNDSTVTLVLYAPGKEKVFALGDFSDWRVENRFRMKRSPTQPVFWTTITGLKKGDFVGYQYQIGSNAIRYADAECELVLDPWNDPWISSNTFPNLPAYPTGKASGIVSVFRPGNPKAGIPQPPMFKKPAKEELVIYELLIRDFVHARNYKSLTDTLDYLKKLGVNAIELMPIMEFEGNESWGYNPSFFLAPDKYYGTADDLRRLVSAAHSKGIAVVLDIALNHAFGQNPQVQMYFDPTIPPYGEPTADNPWFNQRPKHDFNVGYDYNHESQATTRWANKVFRHWVREYGVDGYRVDLSKGFTQKNTLGDVAAWGRYDASRIAILKRIANEVWAEDPEAYMILEHFADNDEEKELADYGFMLWGNLNHEYNEATMGYRSDLSWGSYKARGWAQPHLITYMESHDEERLVFKNRQFGNSGPNHNVKDAVTSLKRVEAAANVFFTIPGPKMLWQFGEVGYDYSINRCPDGSISNSCRTSNKPVRWDFMKDPNRAHLLEIFTAFIHLKTSQPVFNTQDFTLNVNEFFKTVTLRHSSANVVAMSNFDVRESQRVVAFPSTGIWYEYFSRETLLIDATGVSNIALQPGEYRLYTNVEWPQYQSPWWPTSVRNTEKENLIRIYPNPAEGGSFTITGVSGKISPTVFDMLGREILYHFENSNQGQIFAKPRGNVAPGTYILQIPENQHHQILIIP